MKRSCLSSLLFLASLLPLLAVAAPPPVVEPLAAPPPLDDRFVTVDLAGVANGTRPSGLTNALVRVHQIPFVLPASAGGNHLDLRTIGWSAATNEAREYPGYIARYDHGDRHPDPMRAIVTVPVSDYQFAWALAATDDDPALTGDLTLRFGSMMGNGRTDYVDVTASIPRAGDQSTFRGNPDVRLVPTPEGRLYLVRIPVRRNFSQDFKDLWALRIDITRALDIAVNLPDPNRFHLRPLGDPSGVRLYGLTLERPSLEIDLQPAEPGHVFNQPLKPRYTVHMRNHYEHYRPHHFEVETTRDDGVTNRFVFPEFRPWGPGLRVPLSTQEIELDLSARGHYTATFRLVKGAREVLTERTVMLAILAPDTRAHRREGPFGTWDFAGTHNTPADIDLTGSLAVKAGLRYMRPSERHGLEAFNDPAVNPDKVRKMIAEKAANPDFRAPPRVLIFHETSISGPHITRTPETFSGVPYIMNEKEQARFDQLWNEAIETYELMRANFPDTEIYFGNGPPHLVEAFCKRGIPKELLTIAGNESGSFMRPPEAQPTDFVGNNAGLFMFRRILDAHGYTDTKLYQCYEVCYPNTNPGNLSQRKQAQYYARHIMHSLAWGVPLIRVGSITDMANSYYHSNWGGSGFCTAYPRVAPKEAYVAYATLTQVLDGARFRRQVPTGSAALYAFEFERRDGTAITCLWTPRGARDLVLTGDWNGDVILTGLFGREETLAPANGRVACTVSESLVYLRTPSPVRAIETVAVRHPAAPAAGAFVVDPLASLVPWMPETRRDTELETYTFLNLRRPGTFTWSEEPAFEGFENVVRVTLDQPGEGTEYQQCYSALKLKQPVELPGAPAQIGLWVWGNGNGGRVIFELEDAQGERWISIGAEQGGEPNAWMADFMTKEMFEELRARGKAGICDWNSDDAWGDSYLNHDGWRFVTFPLPGQYGRNHDGYHWPRNSQWRFSAEGRVDYPLRFTRLVVTLPEKVLHGTEWRPASSRTIRVSGLVVE